MSIAQNVTPWYRQFWPWFLIALPASAVIAGLATLALAMSHPEALVVDDYYKEGLAINKVLARDHMAKQLGLSAILYLTGGDARVTVSADTPLADTALRLQLLHPTLAHHDVQVVLHRDAVGAFRGAVGELPRGRWYVIVEPLDQRWRLEARMTRSGDRRVDLASS